MRQGEDRQLRQFLSNSDQGEGTGEPDRRTEEEVKEEAKEDEEETKAFDYILLETTGLANPGPICGELWVDDGYKVARRHAPVSAPSEPLPMFLDANHPAYPAAYDTLPRKRSPPDSDSERKRIKTKQRRKLKTTSKKRKKNTSRSRRRKRVR